MNFLKHYFLPGEHNDFRPHIFRGYSIFGIFFVIFFLFVNVVYLSSLQDRGSILASVYPAVLVDLSNHNRAEVSLPTLVINPLLEEAASEKAFDMVSKGYFAHNSPTGVTPWYWLNKVGYSFDYAGENLAINFSDSSDVETAWMNSPGHKANILNVHYTEIGIATAHGVYQGRETTFVVQMFGTPKVSLLPTIKKTNNTSSDAFLVPNPTTSNSIPKVKLDPRSSPVASATVTVLGKKTTISPLSQTASVLSATSGDYSNWFDKLITNPFRILKNIYLLFALFIVVAFASIIFVDKKIRHTHHIVCVVLILGTILLLIALENILFASAVV